MSNNPRGAEHSEYDPVFLNSRREAAVIFSVWLAGLLWAVPFCYLTGYVDNYDPTTFTTILGVPTWLFWGIVVPWLVADVITTWICFCYMKDDDLEPAEPTAEEPGDPDRTTPDGETQA